MDIVAVVIGSLVSWGIFVGALILGAKTQHVWGPWADQITTFLFDR
jgi:hypothetical protein